MARAQQAVGLASYSVDALEASVTAGRAAVELLAMAADPAKDAPPAPKPKLRPGQAPKPASRRADKAKPGAGAKPEAAANTIEGLLVLMEQASRHTVAVLQDAPPAELKRLLGALRCRLLRASLAACCCLLLCCCCWRARVLHGRQRARQERSQPPHVCPSLTPSPRLAAPCRAARPQMPLQVQQAVEPA